MTRGGHSWTARGSETTQLPVAVNDVEAVASCLDRVEGAR